MNIAVVILNWNGEALLRQFLPSVIQYSKDQASIYVIDNKSSDKSLDYLNSFHEVKVILNDQNLGFAGGYNKGLEYIDADIYCLLNSDVEVTKGWLNSIIEAFKTNQDLSIIQPKILNYKDQSKFDYAGAAGGFIDKYGYPYCRGRLFNTIEQDTNQYNDSSSIFWASGACFFIRSQIYNDLNGLDESFFAHMEEIDLCWRAHINNHKIRFVGTSIVYHVGGATLDQSNSKKTYLNFRNSLFMLIKNLPKGSLFSTLFIRLVLDGIAGLNFLFQLKPKHTLAILKAHFSFYFNIRGLLKRRKDNNFKNYFHKTSVVWQYFVFKKRTFNRL